MATGGMDLGVDSRLNCSICLEPYRGRQARILPCFHTFCLPCLKGLVTRETETFDPFAQYIEEEGGKSALRVTCPTCRHVIPVPAGGVTAFQTNFYLDTYSKEEDAPPEPCSLCDGDQTAGFQCGKCQNSFCCQCRRSHDKLCQGGQVTALHDPSDTTSSAQKAASRQVKEQLKMVEDALEKLEEEECKLNQERQAMESSINVRYGTLLSHGADARDACFVSLREVFDSLIKRIYSHMAEARHARDTLQQQLSPSQSAPASASQRRAALFMQGDLQTILKRDIESSPMLRHQMEENASEMINILHLFMGKIVKPSQSSGPAQSQEASGSLGCHDDEGNVSSSGSGSRNLNDLYQKFEDLTGRVTSLQSLLNDSNSKLSSEQRSLQKEMATLNDSNSKLSSEQCSLQKEMATLNDSNSKLSSEQRSLQKEMATLNDSNSKLSSEQRSLQKEMAALKDTNAKLTSALQTELAGLKDKNAIVHQDLAVLRAEKDKGCADLAKLQTDVISLQTDVSCQQTDSHQLKSDLSAVVSKVSTVETDVTALKGVAGSMKSDVSQLKTDCGDLKADVTKARKSLSGFEGDHSKLKADMTASKSQVASLQQNMQSAQDSLQDSRTALSALESRFLKASTQVAFHALLSKEVTTTKEQTLICDDIKCNFGDGYDGKTGLFTAPVAGTYCFLANTSPNRACTEKQARLDIVVDGVLRGYVLSLGYSWSTGHTVVKMTTGQRVWLRTCGDQEYTYSGGWWTVFSGLLVQADV